MHGAIEKHFPVTQQGMAMAFVLVLVLLTVTVWILSLDSLDTYREDAHVQQEQQIYLQGVQAALENWYEQHAATVDASVAPVNVAPVLPILGFPLKWHVTGASSNRLVKGDIAYHVFMVWIPGSVSRPAVLDASTGIFTPGSSTGYERIDGFIIESGLVQHTTQTLQKDANHLQEWFKAKVLQDGQHQVNWNHFRAQDCSEAEPDEMPCMDSYVALSQSGVKALAGLGAADESDGWGNPVQVSNLADSSTVAPPYSMALKSVTPWGDSIRIFATQPL